MDEDRYIFDLKKFENFLKKKKMEIKILLAEEVETKNYVLTSKEPNP
jgi:hypothetical protein